jgi:hypothetical protein
MYAYQLLELSRQLARDSQAHPRPRDDNLRAMCQRCHLTYDARLHARHARITRARKRGQLMFLD